MNLDFTPDKDALYIPKEAYRPKKRCPFCQSYFINDQSCDSCGRNLNYNLLGEPFSFKSYTGLKEKYIQQLGFWTKLFPIFEDKNCLLAQSYRRNLTKRFKDILLGLSSFGLIEDQHRALFFIEAKEIAVELLEYGETRENLILAMENELSDKMLVQHLAQFVSSLSNVKNPLRHWSYRVLEMKLLGVLSIEFLLKFSITMAVIIFTALTFRSFI